MGQRCNATYRECCAVQRLCVFRSCRYDCMLRKMVDWCARRGGCPNDDYGGRPCVPRCALAYVRTVRALAVGGLSDLVARPYECTAPDARRQRLLEEERRPLSMDHDLPPGSSQAAADSDDDYYYDEDDNDNNDDDTMTILRDDFHRLFKDHEDPVHRLFATD